MVEVVVRAGKTVDANSLQKKSQEVTTGDVLESISVYMGKVKDLKQNNYNEIKDLCGTSYKGTDFCVVKKKNFPNKATFKKDTKGGANHYLLGGLTVEEMVKIYQGCVKY
jgi:hypothetical protein